jgi:hypothetical protein
MTAREVAVATFKAAALDHAATGKLLIREVETVKGDIYYRFAGGFRLSPRSRNSRAG